MNKDALKKKIDSKIYIRNHNWNAVALTIGGTLAISLNEPSFYTGILIIVGMFLSIIFLYAYFNKDIEIDKLIKKLEKEN